MLRRWRRVRPLAPRAVEERSDSGHKHREAKAADDSVGELSQGHGNDCVYERVLALIVAANNNAPTAPRTVPSNDQAEICAEISFFANANTTAVRKPAAVLAMPFAAMRTR